MAQGQRSDVRFTLTSPTTFGAAPLSATDHLDMRQIKPDVTHHERQEQTLKLNPN